MNRPLFLSLAVLALSAACSKPSDDASATVGAAGGEVSLGTQATVRVPAGALGSAVQISVARADPAQLPALPAGTSLASDVFAFTPHGTVFSTPVTVELALNRTAGTLRVARLDDPDDTTWEVGAVVTVSGSRGTFQTDRFSYYGLVEADAAETSDGGGSPSDGGTWDGGVLSADGGMADAGAPQSDGGATDAGAPPSDAGPEDAGAPPECAAPVAGAPTGTVAVTGMLQGQPRAVEDAYATTSATVGAGESGTTYSSELRVTLTGYPAACSHEQAGRDVPSDNIVLVVRAVSTTGQPAIPDSPGTYTFTQTPADGVPNAYVSYGSLSNACAQTSGGLLGASVSGSITVDTSTLTEVTGTFTWTENSETLSGSFQAPRCAFTGAKADRCCLGGTTPPLDAGTPDAGGSPTDGGVADGGLPCGAVLPGDAGSASVSGTWLGQTIVPVDAVVNTHVDTANVYGAHIRWLEFSLTDFPGACGYVLADQSRAGGRWLTFRLTEWSSAPVADPSPGTYSFGANPAENTPTFEGASLVWDSANSCTYWSSIGGGYDGSLTIATITPSRVTGSFTSTVFPPDGGQETISGTFDAARCDSSTPTYGGRLCCPP